MRAWIHSLASLKLTLGLLIVLAIALSAGTIVESARGAEAAQQMVYYSPWFRTLLVFLALNLASSLADLWPWSRHRVGYALTHGSMLLILLGATITDRFKTEGVLAIWEGDEGRTVQDRAGSPRPVVTLPFSVRLDAFEIDYYDGTRRPAQFRSRVTVRDAGRDVPAVIEMNRELSYGGYKFFQSSYREAEDRDQTILSVARDPGEALAFLGYFGLVGGMIVVLATRAGHGRPGTAASTLLLAALACGATASAQTIPVPAREDVEALRLLPVQHDGRVMPFDTVAREAVFNVTGRPRLWGLEPAAMALSWAVAPGDWAVQPIVRVDPALAEAAGLPAGTQWASFQELVRSPRVLGLFDAARARSEHETPLTSLDKAAQKLETRLLYMQGFFDRSAFRVLPGQAPGEPWSLPPRFDSIEDLKAVLASGEGARHVRPGALAREVLYNRARPSRLSWWILGLSLALSIAAWIKPVRALGAAATATLALGFAAMSWGLWLRWQVAGRIPASNMYESLLFLGWGVGLFAMVASLFLRSRLVILNAAAMSTLTMALTDLLPIDPFIHPMPPVLAGTYWLAIHVPIIMIGYAVLALGVAVAHMQIGTRLLAPEREDLVLRMNGLLYWYVMVGAILLVAGILTGSMWAAESWGRYWGWDPKEVWSLVAFLAYIAILHARAERLIGAFGMAAWSILAFQTVLMTYLGVNFVLASGLHSYGFGESGVVTWMAIVALAELVFVAAGWLAEGHLAAARSAPASHPLPAPSGEPAPAVLEPAP
ncbi:MAG TPA: cytochrome c biogenesis protein CcsA [Vicinamibacteria bacterium]|nr:cytochrome c biogenesis protein CcsA [Vicinamibacteria bacterium]